MKKLLGVALSLASIGLAAQSTEAKAAKPSTSATVAISAAAAQRGRGYYNRRVYVTTQSRFVRVGRRVYRETYQVRHLPNGATRARLISRVRVR